MQPEIANIDLLAANGRINSLRDDVPNFTRLAALLRSVSGINLINSPKNLSLMAARLLRIIEARKLPGYEAYLRMLETGDKAALQEFVSAMTTNTTMFFRESPHYEILARILPAYLREKRARGSGELRIWCAAASTGQEVYSILMTLLETDPGRNDLNLKVLATDVDRAVLDRASRGAYTEAEMSDVAPLYRQKYFTRSSGTNGDHFVVNASIRRLVTFAPFNLMNETYPFKHGFDVVFCRNVLIYFDRPTATAVTDRLGMALEPGGYLFVGHSEAGIVRPGTLAAEASAVYRRAAGT